MLSQPRRTGFRKRSKSRCLHLVTTPFVKCSGGCSARFSVEVQDSETANWIWRRNDSRPFDTIARSAKLLAANRRGFDVGVADQALVHRVPTGQYYFSKGKAPSRLVSRKKSRFNYLPVVSHYGLKHLSDFGPLGYEVTGGMGYHAARLFAEVAACASISAWSRGSCRHVHLVCDGFWSILLAGNLIHDRQAHGNACSARNSPEDGKGSRQQLSCLTDLLRS